MSEALAIDHDEQSNVSVRGNPRRGARQKSTSAREPARDPVRGGLMVEGRNGEMLTRRQTHNANDPLWFDESIIPPGWEYQWNTTDVFGNQGVARQLSNQMAANGWRPVPAERHPGVFMPADYKGPVIGNGCRLEERPKVLCDEAREEMKLAARRQMRDRDAALMGGRTNMRTALPQGMEMSNRYRGSGGDITMSIDPAIDAPAPRHEYAEPGE